MILTQDDIMRQDLELACIGRPTEYRDYDVQIKRWIIDRKKMNESDIQEALLIFARTFGDAEDIRAMQQINQSEFVDKMIEEFFENDEEEQNDWRKA